MKSKKKVLVTLLCAVLLVFASVMGTLAYLKADDTAVNTFTVGNVGLKLDETDVDIYGVQDGTTRVDGNEYKLIPGHTYTKDPMVTVTAGSEESYVRMIVTITDFADVKAAFGDDFLPQYFVEGWNPAVWETTGVVTEANNTATYEFRYYKTVNTLNGADLALEPLFTSFTVADGVDNAKIAALEEMEIQIQAHAIQADGFADAAAAWAKF